MIFLIDSNKGPVYLPFRAIFDIANLLFRAKF